MRFLTFVPILLFGSLLSVAYAEPQSPTSEKGESRSGGLHRLTAVSGTGPLAPSDTSRFRFAVFGDSQGHHDSSVIKKIFREIHDAQPTRPAFAFSLGDIVVGKDPQDPTKTLKRNFAVYLKLAKAAGVPVFNTPGNHEMDDGLDVPSERMHRLYREVVAPTHGAFNYGNSRFIAVNTEDIPPAGTKPPKPPMEFSYIGEKQLRQLDKDLKANKDKTHIFIMMHYPMKPKMPRDGLNPQSLKKLAAILEKHDNISYVLASHEHLYHNPQDPDNVTSIATFSAGEPTRYLVSGGAGAWLQKMKGTEKLAFYHYLLFKVDGKKIDVTIHRIAD